MTTDRYLVLGAGPVGRAVARELLALDAEVILASRSGRGSVPGAATLSLDARDARAVTEAAAGSRAVFNCLNPPSYHKWPEQWPPMARAAQAAAERTGALLVTASNLYPYAGAAPYDAVAPITERTPETPAGPKGRVRSRMWAQAREAIAAGRLHALEVRSGTYLGGGSFSTLAAAIGPVIKGRGGWVLSRPDQLHAWAFVPDVARTLVAASLDERAWDRLWLTPSPEPKTQSEALAAIAAAAGRPRRRVHTIPEAALRTLGVAWPMAREQRELVGYRRLPFVIDASATTRALGVEASPWPDIAADVIATTP